MSEYPQIPSSTLAALPPSWLSYDTARHLFYIAPQPETEGLFFCIATRQDIREYEYSQIPHAGKAWGFSIKCIDKVARKLDLARSETVRSYLPCVLVNLHEAASVERAGVDEPVVFRLSG